jgi:hypothetical protein
MNDNRTLDLSFFSDEAWFHLSGYGNSQNCRIWSTEDPHVFQETPLHPIKVGVWLPVSRRRHNKWYEVQGANIGSFYEPVG